jgi:hypothetical protein
VSQKRKQRKKQANENLVQDDPLPPASINDGFARLLGLRAIALALRASSRFAASAIPLKRGRAGRSGSTSRPLRLSRAASADPSGLPRVW